MKEVELFRLIRESSGNFALKNEVINEIGGVSLDEEGCGEVIPLQASEEVVNHGMTVGRSCALKKILEVFY